MPRRRRYASKSKGGSREWPAAGGAAPGRSARRLPLIASSSPSSSDRGSGDQRAARASRRAPRSRPAATSTSADEPKAPRPRRGEEVGPQATDARRRGCGRRSGRARRGARVREAACRAPAPRRRPQGGAPAAGQRGCDQPRRRRARARRRDSASASPPPRHAIETCQGDAARARRPRRVATCRSAASGEARLDVGAAPHGCSASRSASKRFSPMPSTSRSSRQRTEAAVLRAVLDDSLRQRRADAVELVELLDRGRSRGSAWHACGAGWSRAWAGRWSRARSRGAAPRLPARARSPAGRPRAARRGSRPRRSARGRGPPARSDRVGHARACRAASHRPGWRTAPATCT